jgi:hypothetical protein
MHWGATTGSFGAPFFFPKRSPVGAQFQITSFRSPEVFLLSP